MIGAILEAGELILKGASALASHRGQSQQKKASDAAAVDAFSETSRALARQQEEAALASAQQVYQISQDATAQRGALTANAATAGVDGATVNALESDLMHSEFSARDIIDRNLAMTSTQIDQARRSAISEMNARKNGVQAPSSLATGLQIGGALTAFGYDWLKLHPQESKTNG